MLARSQPCPIGPFGKGDGLKRDRDRDRDAFASNEEREGRMAPRSGYRLRIRLAGCTFRMQLRLVDLTIWNWMRLLFRHAGLKRRQSSLLLGFGFSAQNPDPNHRRLSLHQMPRVRVRVRVRVGLCWRCL